MCALSVTCGDSSPKGRAKSTAGSFLIMPNTLVINFTAWLSLRGKTSPVPGEDVTAGDKRGNLARERLRGFSPLKVSRKPFRSAALSQKAALQLPFSVTTPPVKMEHRSAFKIVPRKKQPPHFLVQRLLCLCCKGYQPFRKAGRGLPSLSHW